MPGYSIEQPYDERKQLCWKWKQDLVRDENPPPTLQQVLDAAQKELPGQPLQELVFDVLPASEEDDFVELILP